jgi:phosphatidylserine/phosphatidylglycerophosphate/cardiolipin synthase-like enzyme
VISALDQAARRGVRCRIALTENPAWTKAAAEVSAAGCSVHLLPATRTTVYMHEKILLTDSTMLVIGSQNLSTASLLENRGTVPRVGHIDRAGAGRRGGRHLRRRLHRPFLTPESLL